MSLMAIALAGCQSQPPLQVPKEVRVIISVPCLKALPTEASLKSDSELLALDRYHRTLVMWDERREMQEKIARDRAALESCVAR
jgi:hypothetical protein